MVARVARANSGLAEQEVPLIFEEGSPMRRLMMCMTAALTAAVMATAAQAPAKIATMQDHVALMKSNAQANGALNKALGSAAYADARMQVATLRQNLRTLEMFWTEKKRDEPVKIVKEGLGRLDSLEKMLSASAPDQMAAQAAAKEFGGNTCGACHKQFREGDAQTGFKFREPGIL
jgi:cytochrome c556